MLCCAVRQRLRALTQLLVWESVGGIRQVLNYRLPRPPHEICVHSRTEHCVFRADLGQDDVTELVKKCGRELTLGMSMAKPTQELLNDMTTERAEERKALKRLGFI